MTFGTRGYSYGGGKFAAITQLMARNGDVMTRQVHRQLQRYRWKAHFKVSARRGVRCPYERAV